MSKSTNANQEIHVLDDFVCQAIPDPSLAIQKRPTSTSPQKTGKSSESKAKKTRPGQRKKVK